GIAAGLAAEISRRFQKSRAPALTAALRAVSEIRAEPLADRAAADPRSLYAGHGGAADGRRPVRNRAGRDQPRVPVRPRSSVSSSFGRRPAGAIAGWFHGDDEEPTSRPAPRLAYAVSEGSTRTQSATRLADALESIFALFMASRRRGDREVSHARQGQSASHHGAGSCAQREIPHQP